MFHNSQKKSYKNSLRKNNKIHSDKKRIQPASQIRIHKIFTFQTPYWKQKSWKWCNKCVFWLNFRRQIAYNIFLLLIALLKITLNLKIIEKFIWQCVFVILLVVSIFLVMKAEHTVARYNGREFTSKIATVYVNKWINFEFGIKRAIVFFVLQ
jgi:hypothetical protein